MVPVRSFNPAQFLRSSFLPFLIAVCCITFCGCKNRTKTAEKIPPVIPQDDAQFKKQFSGVLKAYVKDLPAKSDDKIKYAGWQEIIKDIYTENNYQAIWVSRNVLTEKGKQLYEIVNTAEYYGLNKELYSVKKLNALYDSLQKISPAVDYEKAMQLETGLTRAFCEMALHLEHGMFADTIQGINSNFWTGRKKYPEMLLSVSKGGSIDSTFHSLEPQNPVYERYMKALREFVSKNNISTEPIRIRDPKADSSGAVEDARKALVIHHYLPDSLRHVDSAFYASLKQFQKDNGLNPDGRIGMMTQKTLERDNSLKFQLLAVNADRWRKEDNNIPKRYVWVNLPACKLRIVENDSIKMEKNVVIGKADREHPTPTLKSSIDNIVLWPNWSVPQSIIKKEMKSFKGYIVNEKNGWKEVIQPPGPNNSLGSVKIQFPNKYSVYIHDTPSKYLFNSDYRAQSHGCVRLQDPLEVAAYLMQMDTFRINYDSLKAIKQAKVATQNFRLQKPIPVFFKYFTAEVDGEGKLHYYNDVYKHDAEMMAFIFGKKQPAKTAPPAAKKTDSLIPANSWQSIPVVEMPAKDSVKTVHDSSGN